MTTVSRYVPEPTSRRSFSWHAPRSRGALTGLLLVLLGVWGALIPLVGPMFRYAYTPDTAWTLTTGRLWLEVVPGAAAALGGLGVLLAAHRAAGVFWAWIAALAGGWFLVGPAISRLWNHGEAAIGNPVGPSTLARVVQEIGFMTGLGVAIVFLAAVALGRFTVVGVREVQRAADTTVPMQRAEDQGIAATPSPTPPVGHGTTDSTQLNQP